MTTQDTTTTGTVKGIQECKDFTRMAQAKFNMVHVVVSPMPIEGYMQYTLLANNEIKIYK